MQVESLNHFKSVTVHKLFVAPADNDYLIARWLLVNKFYPDYFWHASQAIEKYLKAGLLLNKQLLANGSHDLVSLYKLHQDNYGILAFSKFTKPEELSADLWVEGTVEQRIIEIDRLGEPDSRYGLTSWYRKPDDLFKLDQLCWNFRRLCIGLDWVIGEDFNASPSDQLHLGKTYASALTEDAVFCPRGNFYGLANNMHEMGENRSDILHSWNFEFKREGEDIAKFAPSGLASPMGPAGNSYLSLYWESLTSEDADGNLRPLDENFLNGMRWLIGAIKLPKSTKVQLCEQLAKKRSESH